MSSRENVYASCTSSFRFDASSTPETPDPDRATRPAAAAAAAAALRGLMAPVSKQNAETSSRTRHPTRHSDVLKQGGGACAFIHDIQQQRYPTEAACMQTAGIA